ncbi:FxSxx-COOH system tetratricopeptide repeat protein [Actinomadura livida]|uniref:Tetratricopeptide (TPR) repeat protein n=1 Tax=Actinomadura livida TaxID=79909 RepID=A0A7W7MWR2_9ACTN|nr:MULTISPECIES: FxSxx-COOH system tetratricopeptide repeat protein [Actinomadura]MBB4773075.1 tetratricopeptide (TPR) repeat protein [Actinomadura catellatispora]GGU17743.1 cytochrome c [Actinomadura livida]
MIGQLVEALRALDPQPTAGELADALWLADWLQKHEGPAHQAADGFGEPSAAGPPGSPAPPDPPPGAPAARDREPPPPRTVEAGLYLAGQNVPATAFPVRMPAVPAISRTLHLSRALRPLRATVPSLTREHLDEAATAQRIAETGVCEPVMVPAQERRYDLALIADVGPSMVVWRQTVEELRLLLQHLGAFRDVRTWYLDSGARRLSLRTGSAFGIGADRDPDELADPTHRRLILVVSDCIGAAWQDGRAAALLDRWGRAGTVAIAQPLPQRLWWRTAAAIEPVRFGASGPAVVNEQLTVTRTPPQLPDDRPLGIPIPVVELSERWLRSWAGMVARGGRDIMGAALFTGRPVMHPPPADTGDAAVSPEMRVKQFRASSSPTAFKLATYLAAAPLRLPVMRLVQRAMLPASTSADLAEVFLSGMLRMVGRPSDGGEEEIVYEFHDGVREILLQGLRRREVYQVLRAVWSVVRERIGSSMDFPALLAAVQRGEAQLPPDLPFAQVAAQALAGLGGPYREMAKRLTSENAPDTPSFGEAADARDAVSPPAAADGAAAADPVPLPRSGLPGRNPDFVGRDRLLAGVRDALRDGMAVLLPHSELATGGEGKSNLALEYAYRHADDYDLVWWIPAEQTTSSRAALALLARQLGMPMSDDIKTTVDGVLRALCADRPYVRWLLIYDNAQDPEQIFPLTPLGVDGVEPGLGPGRHVLVTSRDRRWERHASVVEIDVFERAESITLLRRLVPGLSEVEADMLSERVGDLPLAVHQAAAWQIVTGGTVEDYLRLFDQRLIEDAAGEPPGDDLPRPLAAGVRLNLDRLREENPVAGQLLELWAVFDPEPVSCRLLAAGRAAALPPGLKELLADETRLRDAMRDISRFSLAKFDEESGTLQVHRLVRAIIDDRLAEDVRRQASGYVHAILAAATPEEEPAVESTWERRSEITPHVVPSGVFEADDIGIRRVGIDQANFLYQSGEYEGSRRLAEIALDRWLPRYGPDDAEVLGISRVLVNALRGLGDNRAAAELSEDNLNRTQRKFGVDHPDTIFAATGFGADLRFRGEFRRAYEIDLRAWRRMRQLLGPDAPGTHLAASNLALDLRILGEFQKAYEIDQEVWKRGAESGQTYRLRFRTTHNLARDLHALGRYDQACKRQAESLDTLRPVLGGGHAMVLQARMSYAGTLRKLGRYEEAHRVAAETFAAYVRRFGEEHPNTLASKVCLALTASAAGRPREALPLIDEALDCYRRVMGEAHPFVHVCATDRAVILRRLAEVYAAQETDQIALSNLTAGILGPNHHYALCASVGLANDYYLLGEMESAVRLLSETLQKMIGALGERHPYSLAVRHNLVRARAAMGGDEHGIEPILVQLAQALGRSHPEVLAAERGELLECDIEPTAL